MADLQGRWDADSTYTIDDVQSTFLGASGLLLEIFPDSTWSAWDSTRTVFPGRYTGRFTLHGDTLLMRGIRGTRSSVDTMAVKLRFLGNRLELDQPSAGRYSFFHKRKPLDSVSVDSLLRDSLWLHVGTQVDPDSLRLEPLRADFDYVRFGTDRMAWDYRRQGIATTDSGSLVKSGANWTWRSNSGDREILIELMQKDSLRLWSFAAGRLDSGFHIFRRAFKRHPFDLDMRPALGHLRSDSIKTNTSSITNDYGQYYDLIVRDDHSVEMETDMPALPIFSEWKIDSGSLWLSAGGKNPVKFRLDTLSPPRIRMTTDSGAAFSRVTQFFQSKVDGARFAAHPLERFDSAGYFRISFGPDSLWYFSLANFRAGAPARHEIASIAGTDTLWSALSEFSDRETFTSGQPNFFFAFEARNSALGKFTCVATPSQEFAIRLVNNSDPSVAEGQVQGTCVIRKSEKPASDSLLSIDGAFRLKRNGLNRAFSASLWNLQ